MFRRILGVLAGLTLLVHASQEYPEGAKPFYGDERPARSIRIGKEPQLVLTAQTTEIVVAPGAAKSVLYAANTLKKYLDRRLGGQVPLVAAPTEGRVSLFVGFSDWSRKAGIDEKAFCRDAFVIRTVGNAVYLAGIDHPTEDLERNDRRGGIWGTLQEHASTFAVQDFLERFCGVRFYFPYEEGIYVPAASAVELPAIDLFDRPDFEARNVSAYAGADEGGDLSKASLADVVSYEKNVFTKRLRLQTLYIPNCHGLSSLELTRRFYETHPEYFALRSDGQRQVLPSMGHVPQLCYSSGVFDEIKLDALAELRRQSPATRGMQAKVWYPTHHLPGLVFGCMSQDGFVACACQDCRNAAKAEGGIGELVWRRVAETAAFVKAELGPGHYVSNSAYFPCAAVPKVELPDNVLVEVDVRGPWNCHLKDKLQGELDLIQAWNRKLGHKTWLWNYCGKYGMSIWGVPNLAPRAIGRYYGAVKDLVWGAYMESETDRYAYNHLNFYVFSRVMWDKETDVDALLDEYYSLMFGKGAKPMQAAFEDMEDTWLLKIAGRCVNTPLGPVTSPPSDVELWEEVYSKAHLEKLAAWFDEAERLAAGEPQDAARVRLMRGIFLEPIQARRGEYMKENDSMASFVEHLPAELHLVQFQKKDPRNLDTTVQVALEGDALKVVFHCQEPDMEHVVAPDRPRDTGDIWSDNEVEIFVDPSGERKEFFQILLNSQGAYSDNHGTSLGRKKQLDSSWDSHADINVEKGGDGWTARVSIPVASFGKALNPKGFVANFTRNRVTTADGSQYYCWSPFLVSGFTDLEHFGTLVPEAAPPSRNVVANPNFDGRPRGRLVCDHWVMDGKPFPEGASVSLDPSTFVKGRQSLRLSYTNADKPVLFKVNQGIAARLKTSTRYRVTYYVKTEDVKPLKKGGGVFFAMWHEKNHWWPSNPITGTHSWLKQSAEFTSSAKCPDEPAYLKPILVYCTGTAWFDAIEIEEIKEN